MLYLTCTTITSIDLAHYGVSRAKDWVSVKCGTRTDNYALLNYMFSSRIRVFFGGFRPTPKQRLVGWLVVLGLNGPLRQYRKNSTIWDTSNNCHNCPKIGKV